MGSVWVNTPRGLQGRRHLLDEVDAGLEVHAEVDELPLDALLLVLLLLQHEHVVVEELLQLLVGEVDAQLLEAVELRKEGDGELSTTPHGVAGLGRRPEGSVGLTEHSVGQSGQLSPQRGLRSAK